MPIALPIAWLESPVCDSARQPRSSTWNPGDFAPNRHCLQAQKDVEFLSQASGQIAMWNLDKLTDAEIYTAILYLEQDPKSASEQQDDAAALVTCVSLAILLLFCLGLAWFYW
jgi:hypothetical protein